MNRPTKQEIRAFTRRTREAAREIDRLLTLEKKIRADGNGEALEDSLRDWAEEISGCGSEVQNLIHARFALD